MQKVIKIDGGIGRIICASPALNKLAAKEDFLLLTTWPDVFLHSELSKRAYWAGVGDSFELFIKDNEYVIPEPYHDHHFYNQKHHLIESFNHLLNGEACMDRPQLNISDAERSRATFLANRIKKPNKVLVALQLFGSTSSMSENKLVDQTFRSLSLDAGYFLIDNLSDRCQFVNFSHLRIDHPSVTNLNQSLRDNFALIEQCDLIISIDSLLQHVGYALDKKGMVLGGATSFKNFGYLDHYYNVSREGFPKASLAFRIQEEVAQNREAMNFSKNEMTDVLDEFRKLFL